eukprot:scaffold22714_cov155-Cylindrotheca_fusiformis.AAC.2
MNQFHHTEKQDYGQHHESGSIWLDAFPNMSKTAFQHPPPHPPTSPHLTMNPFQTSSYPFVSNMNPPQTSCMTVSTTLDMCTRALQELAQDEANLEPIPINEQQMNILHGEEANGLLLASLNKKLNEDETDLLKPLPIHSSISDCNNSSANVQKRPSSSSLPSPRPRKQRKGKDDNQVDRFRVYQSGLWAVRFAELLQFKQENDHCCVRHGGEKYPVLARWVKRQRYQYKLRMEGKPSTMTDSRVSALERIGFVWKSHGAAWMERFQELKELVTTSGTCSISMASENNMKLATWVKCQRRQYKMYMQGKPTSITPERIAALESIDGFEWEIRKCSKLMFES